LACCITLSVCRTNHGMPRKPGLVRDAESLTRLQLCCSSVAALLQLCCSSVQSCSFVATLLLICCSSVQSCSFVSTLLAHATSLGVCNTFRQVSRRATPLASRNNSVRRDTCIVVLSRNSRSMRTHITRYDHLRSLARLLELCWSSVAALLQLYIGLTICDPSRRETSETAGVCTRYATHHILRNAPHSTRYATQLKRR
jgi:hypothetical protein